MDQPELMSYPGKEPLLLSTGYRSGESGGAGSGS